jgi:DNA-directed RNA polymerase subunit RPC12/RpoP
MPISFECHQCGKKLKAPDDAVGRASKCPACGARVICPGPVSDAEVANRSPVAAEVGSSSDADDGAPYLVVDSEPAAAPATEARRPYPMCGEMIVATAAKCRFCGEIFDPALKKGGRSGKGRELRTIATTQKFLIICILVQVVMYLVVMSQQRQRPPAPPSPMALVASLVLLIAWVAGIVCAFVLAIKVYKTAIGILMGLLAAIPCLGLLILGLINGRTNRTLKDNGIDVGLFGANLSKI